MTGKEGCTWLHGDFGYRPHSEELIHGKTESRPNQGALQDQIRIQPAIFFYDIIVDEVAWEPRDAVSTGRVTKK